LQFFQSIVCHWGPHVSDTNVSYVSERQVKLFSQETTNLSMIFHALELVSHLAQSVNQQAYSGILLPACRFTELAYEYRIPACIEIETARCWSWYVRGVQWRRLVWLWLLTSMNQAGTASTASQLAQFCVAIHQHSGYSVSG
jgi:hypothetical protein